MMAVYEGVSPSSLAKEYRSSFFICLISNAPGIGGVDEKREARCYSSHLSTYGGTVYGHLRGALHA